MIPSMRASSGASLSGIRDHYRRREVGCRHLGPGALVKSMSLLIFTRANCCVAAVAAMAVATGSRKERSAKERAKSDAEPQVVAKLDKADEHNGTIDRMVTNCRTCTLQMDGRHKHMSQVSGYTLRFRAEHYKEEYQKDPAGAILALRIPED